MFNFSNPYLEDVADGFAKYQRVKDDYEREKGRSEYAYMVPDDSVRKAAKALSEAFRDAVRYEIEDFREDEQREHCQDG